MKLMCYRVAGVPALEIEISAIGTLRNQVVAE